MSSLLSQFLVEARDQIAAATDGLLGLERNPVDREMLNGVFRSVHTLKGSSGLFDLPALTAVLHAAEDLLVALREQVLVLHPAMLDQIFAAIDLVSAWLDGIGDTESLPPDAALRGEPVVGALRSWLAGDAAAVPPGAPIAEPRHEARRPDWLACVPAEVLLDAVEQSAVTGEPLVAVSYRPETHCFFKGDDPFALIRQVPDLLHLEVERPAAWPPLADADPYACIIGFRALSIAPRDEVRHLLRYVETQVEVVDVGAQELLAFAGMPSGSDAMRMAGETLLAFRERGDRAALARSAEAFAGQATHPGDASILRWLARLAPNHAIGETELESLARALATGAGPVVPEVAGRPPLVAKECGALPEMVAGMLRAQQDMLAAVRNPAWQAGCIGSAAKLAANALRFAGRERDAQFLSAEGGRALAGIDSAVLLRAIDSVLAPPAAGAIRPDGAGSAPDRPLGVAATAAAPPPADAAQERASTVLRVDQARVDALMNLIGELVVAKNGLPFLAGRAEQVYGSREMAREIKEQHAVIDRIALELRNSIMQVRMLPVSTVFQRFPRLVRDLSRKLGKQVELVIEGEDTQADKTVIENLFEPLLHLVRNSLDHGIEPDRAAVGKPETARLTLSATQDSDQVVISVGDDGRGIDPAVIRRKAVEKGVLGEEAAAQLSDGDAVNLIFAAGFSTAAAVTDVSGRGVGMDAVRIAIEKTGGRVEVSSVAGAGTRIMLRLPLSMAVTRVMTVAVAGSQFGIPMDAIEETVRIPRSRVVAIKDRQAFLLRDRIVPLVHLDRVLELPCPVETREMEEIAVLVVRVDKQPVGLAIEAFGEGMEVIVKPMEGILAGASGYLGTALLGNGKVLLVLDLKEIVE